MSAITVLSLTILTVSAAAAPSAGAQSVQYFQYNVWGNKGAFGSGNLQSINYLTANFDYYVGVGAAPMAVSVQELCQGTTNSQANTLAAHLSPFGYTGTFYTADLDLDRPDSCELFGNAIYGYGSSAPDPSKQFAGGFSAQQSYSPGAEQRGIACGVYPFFGTVHTACSTHLDSSSTSVAGNQYDEAGLVANNTRVTHPGFAHYIAGDLNLCYYRVVLRSPTLYTNYYESDGVHPVPVPVSCSAVSGKPWYTHSIEPGKSLTQKLDYLFLHKTGYSSGLLQRDISSSNPSDHAFLVGAFTYP